MASFLSLPTEIRAIVYRYLFADSSVLGLPYQCVLLDRNYGFENYASSQTSSILQTCRKCYQESRSIFYNMCRFDFRPIKFGPVLCNFQLEEIQHSFGSNAVDVRHVRYSTGWVEFVDQVKLLFPNIALLELSLAEEFYPSDQTSFDKAIKIAKRDKWKHAIQDALLDNNDDEGYPIDLSLLIPIHRLQRLGSDRGFKVLLHWSHAYRFLEFRGVMDLDESVLRIWDAEGKVKQIYEIPQQRLSLPNE